MIARDIRISPVRKSYLYGHIWNRLLTKRIRSRWLDIGLTLFCVFVDLNNAKKNSWPISSHVDRILLVNNAYRNTDGFHSFFFLSCKETVLRGCVVFSQTWMSSNNLLSPPTHPSLIFFPYLTFVQCYRRCILLGATSVYFYSIISFKLNRVLVTARTLFKPGGGV